MSLRRQIEDRPQRSTSVAQRGSVRGADRRGGSRSTPLRSITGEVLLGTGVPSDGEGALLGAVAEAADSVGREARRLLLPDADAEGSEPASFVEAVSGSEGGQLVQHFDRAVRELQHLTGRRSGRWKPVQEIVLALNTRLAGAVRSALAETAESGEKGSSRRAVLCEALLRTGVLTGAHFRLGPYLHPLILKSHSTYAELCRDHDLDPSHLHRVLAGEASLSLGRLETLLKAIQSSSGRSAPMSYELRFVSLDGARSLCFGDSVPRRAETVEGRRETVAATEARPGQERLGRSLDELCADLLRSPALSPARWGRGPTRLIAESYSLAYVRRVLRRTTPGSFPLFALLAFPRYAIVPRRVWPTERFLADRREETIRFDLDFGPAA